MKTVKRLGVVAALGLGIGLVPASADAQSACNSGAKVLDAIWGRWGERIKAKACKSSEECLANNQKKEELVREMIAFWNEQSQGSWATIGPRPLLSDGSLNDGKVIAGGARLFVSQAPLDGDKWELVVTKQGGGAADVSVAWSDGKSCSPQKTLAFDKDDKPGTKKSAVVDKGMGMLGVVKVDARGTNAFDYKLTFQRK
jgi:hypothetical protein